MKYYCFLVTGTYHASWVYAHTEGEARRTFHRFYNGESIIHIEKKHGTYGY